MVDVQVNVLRNINKPVFRKDRYEMEIDERTAYGTVVLNVTAVDTDFVDQPGVSINFRNNESLCCCFSQYLEVKEHIN